MVWLIFKSQLFKMEVIIQILCSHFIAARVNRVGLNHVALRMRFVTSHLCTMGLVWWGEAHLIIWRGVVITTQRFSINLIRLQHSHQTVYFARTATPHHRSQLCNWQQPNFQRPDKTLKVSPCCGFKCGEAASGRLAWCLVPTTHLLGDPPPVGWGGQGVRAILEFRG